MLEFFHAGGPGMWVTLVLGGILIARVTQAALRPEPGPRWALMLAGATLGSASLNFCLGLMATFRYIEHVPAGEQFGTACLGVEESLHNMVLALILLTIAAIVSVVGSLRSPTVHVA